MKTREYGKIKMLTKPVWIHGYDVKTGNVVVLEDAAEIDAFIKDKTDLDLEKPTYEYFYKEYDVNAEIANVGTTTENYKRAMLFTWDGNKRMQNGSKWFTNHGLVRFISSNVSLKDAAAIIASAKGIDFTEAKLDVF